MAPPARRPRAEAAGPYASDVEQRPLPEPGSEELFALVGPSSGRVIYEWLYRRRGNPPTMGEVRLFMADAIGEDQEHVGHRLRELRRHFEIVAVPTAGSDPRYELRGWSASSTVDASPPISGRLRAQVLMPQRCAQCGRSPIPHGVVLQVDHRIPQSWGGTNEPENLQPLCEDCNHGKRDYFQTYEHHADKVRAAITYDEPQKRIGELLRAFKGEWVPSELLGLVASAKEYQEDWQKRTRELRMIGWDFETEKRYNEGARVRSYYRLKHSAPWPDNVGAEIRAEEARRRRAKKVLADSS